MPGAAAVSPPQRLAGGNWAIDVTSKAPPLDPRSQDLVRDLRALPGDALVTGTTAGYLDLQESLVDHLPLVLAIVVVVTFAVLFVMTGSVVLPIKQVLMNALGLSAVFGILVLVFQDGRFEGLLGYTSQGGLESTQPLLLFAVVFGLSTDYGVFLLSRIKEARDAGHDNSEAVAIGLERTGRIVTAAALLLLHRDRSLRDLADHLHQGAGLRRGDRRADRRDDHPRAARARADAAAGRVELVGARARWRGCTPA